MRINNNIMALNAHRQLKVNTFAQGKSLEKLSSGYRINRAGDDAAGLAISEKMRGQIRGLTKASENAQNGISLIQTAEGALNETHAILQRMRELVVQAANDTNEAGDRTAIQSELTALTAEITRIADKTTFNNTNLLTGSLATATVSLTLLIGANSAEIITISIKSMSGGAFSLGTVGVTNTGSAQLAITDVNSAITQVSTARANLGAIQNRLEHTIKNLDTAGENLQASESLIRDVDMAKEMMEFTKNNILNQAATAMLAQANQAPQGVLQLLS
jgi:flagellin